MEWGYVEHVGIRIRSRSDIDGTGDHAAEEEKRENFQIVPPCMSCGPCHAAEKSQKEQEKVPDKPVQRHGPVRMHESRRNGECHDTAEKTEILQESRGAAECLFRAQKRCCQTEIHGDAAELEREVPPVVMTVEFDEV